MVKYLPFASSVLISPLFQMVIFWYLLELGWLSSFQSFFSNRLNWVRSVLTLVRLSMCRASMGQRSTESISNFSMALSSRLASSFSTLFRLLFTSFFSAGVCTCFGVNHIRVLCLVLYSLFERKSKKAGTSRASWSKKSVSSLLRDGIFLTQNRVSWASILIKLSSLLLQRINFPKNSTSRLSLPLASSLFRLVVLRYLIRSVSSSLLNSTSSTHISNLLAQSALNWLAKLSLVR